MCKTPLGSARRELPTGPLSEGVCKPQSEGICKLGGSSLKLLRPLSLPSRRGSGPGGMHFGTLDCPDARRYETGIPQVVVSSAKHLSLLAFFVFADDSQFSFSQCLSLISVTDLHLSFSFPQMPGARQI